MTEMDYQNASGKKSTENIIKNQPSLLTHTKKRGRPKGSTSMSLATARKFATKEKKEIRRQFTKKMIVLKKTIRSQQQKHKKELKKIQTDMEVMQQREKIYRTILEKKMALMAKHLHDTLIDWAKAELNEAMISKRGRGRPRKIL